MIGSILWGEMVREMTPQHLSQPLWTWSWIGCWARCLVRYVEVKGKAVFLLFLVHLCWSCFVTHVLSPLPGAHTLVAICVAGVLPQEECPHAEASGLAPGTERGPGPGAGSEAACCGQQALPHQQGPL